MNGVWIHYAFDVGAYVKSIHAEEIEALRAMNEAGYGFVCFVEFGKDFADQVNRKNVRTAH